jgi:hypothetical protein
MMACQVVEGKKATVSTESRSFFKPFIPRWDKWRAIADSLVMTHIYATAEAKTTHPASPFPVLCFVQGLR